MADRMIDRRAFVRSLALLGALGALPAPVLARVRAGDWQAVDTLFAELVPAKVPGLAAAIGRGFGEPEFLEAGTLARDSQRAVGPDSLWRIYSMTKPVTGMAAMMLIEDGKLALDQNIADFIPGFANPRVQLSVDTLESRPAKGPITVRHLLTHTAGLGYSIVTKGPLLAEYLRLGITPAALTRKPLPDLALPPTAPSLGDFADRLATLPLIADPGTKWSYSVSLDLLGRVIERASGKSFEDFLQERMFGPLGMKSTFWRVPESEAARLVTNYMVGPKGNAFPIDPGQSSIYLDKAPFAFGGAGLVSSARDYDRFLLMLLGEGAIGKVRVMRPETVRLGMSNLLPDGIDTTGTFAEGQGFGAGGRVVIKPVPGGPGLGTFGWAGAAATIGWVDPANGLRAAGYAQHLPDSSYGFPTSFSKAVYAGLA